MTTTLLVATLASNAMFPIHIEVEVGKTIRPTHLDSTGFYELRTFNEEIVEVRFDTPLFLSTGQKVGASLVEFAPKQGKSTYGVVVVRRKS